MIKGFVFYAIVGYIPCDSFSCLIHVLDHVLEVNRDECSYSCAYGRVTQVPSIRVNRVNHLNQH